MFGPLKLIGQVKLILVSFNWPISFVGVGVGKIEHEVNFYSSTTCKSECVNFLRGQLYNRVTGTVGSVINQ